MARYGQFDKLWEKQNFFRKIILLQSGGWQFTSVKEKKTINYFPYQCGNISFFILLSTGDFDLKNVLKSTYFFS